MKDNKLEGLCQKEFGITLENLESQTAVVFNGERPCPQLDPTYQIHK